jgi:alcohol dehydrogenase (cytochrome c)
LYKCLKDITINDMFWGVSKKRCRGVLGWLTIALIAIVALTLFLGHTYGLAPFILGLNLYRSASNPVGALVIEVREPVIPAPVALPPDGGNWSSYNRNLASQRFAPLDQINTKTVAQLKVVCTYDTGLHENFQTGPLMVEGALIGTTAFDIFSIDPSNCHENWRTHEDYRNVAFFTTSRGAAYLDGRLFRGTLDGRVLAYDFKSGKRLWETTVADSKAGEVVDAAPIAWNGLVFIGNAPGDVKGIKGRVYALAADTGKIVWETYLVPKSDKDVSRGPAGAMPAAAAATWVNVTRAPISGGATWTSYTLDSSGGRLYVPVGNPAPAFMSDVRKGRNLYTNSVLVLDARTGNYIEHYEVGPADWHDWDVSNTPSIVTARSGRKLISFVPKDGYLFSFDVASGDRLYKSPVTRIENVEAPLVPRKGTHFCPGTSGGGDWNGVAYDPSTNLILSGVVDWCTTVTLQTRAEFDAVKTGEFWPGNHRFQLLDLYGRQDPQSSWAGWIYATDADSGEWKWRAKDNYPILSGITPTAGGLTLFGDIGGNLYALDSSSGAQLWAAKLHGAIGGGVITYVAGGVQMIAVAAGMTSLAWPGEPASGKIVVLGISDGSR